MCTAGKSVRDFLIFWSQVVLTLYFIPRQVDKMAVSTEGLLLTSFLLVDMFIALNLVLAFEGHWHKPSKNTARTVIVYIQGVVLYTIFIMMFLYNSNIWWKPKDTIAVWVSLAGVIYATVYALRQGKSLADPGVKTRLGVFFRISPQVILGWNILADKGAGGLSGAFVLVFHILTLLRMSQIGFIILEKPDDKSRKALFVMELVNWLSWCFVTLAWLMYK